MTLTLLKIPGSVLESSSKSHESISFLTKVMNKGYDIPKNKYKVIKSTRIKNENVFLNDLGIHIHGSFLLLLIRDSNDAEDLDISQLIKTRSFQEKTADEDLSFEGITTENILATIGAKPKSASSLSGQGWEITGFTSFYKGVGKFLVSEIENIARVENKDYLYATVIVEHELVGYYEKLGFKEFGERELLTIDETGLVHGSALEDGVYASQDFHVASLQKVL